MSRNKERSCTCGTYDCFEAYASGNGLRKTAIERSVDSEFIDLQLAMSDEEIKKMYQNGLLGAIAPHNDYWNDMFSETYHPVSEWQGPSGLSWINT